MKLSIIIPTKDRALILQRTVNCIVESIKNLSVEVIVINDSDKVIDLNFDKNIIKIIDNPNKGAASARNAGVKQATGDLLLFMDDDMLIHHQNLLKTFELHTKGDKKAYNFFWIYPPDLIENLNQTSFGRYVLLNMLFTNSYRIKIENKYNESIKANGLTSQYFSILKTDFLKTGGYNENIPFAGIEDYILFKEMQKHNIDVFISNSDIIFQNESDRISLDSVMERQRRGAITIKKARELGFKELEIVFSPVKNLFYPILVKIRWPIYKISKAIPNNSFFDFMYFKMVNLLLGLSSFEGYKSEK